MRKWFSVALVCLAVAPGACLTGCANLTGPSPYPPSLFQTITPRGPDQIPERLYGCWDVSLCIGDRHMWLRYENVETGEVHTLARFRWGFGDYTDPDTGEKVLPNVPVSGLYWDQDLRFEKLVTRGKFQFLTVRVQDPIIYQADGKVFGYFFPTNSCVHFARDAWHFYSGEWYNLPPMPLPLAVALQIRCRYSGIPWNIRYGF